MDPSHYDPDHSPSQYAPFATFPTSNNSFLSSPNTAPTNPFFDSQQPLSEIFNHAFQSQPQLQPEPHPLPLSQHQHEPLPQHLPLPMSQSQPLPQSQPEPQHLPLPQSQYQHYPLPMSQSQLMPQLEPQHLPMSLPHPQHMPQSQPQHLPMSLPHPQHMPQSQPQHQPQPLPMSQSQPQHMALSLPQVQHLHLPQSQPQPHAQHQPKAQPQSSPSQVAHLPPLPSSNHRPYTEMICRAIAELNEPDGSSKLAISKYIERSYPDFPHADASLMSHHLNTLKSTGVLTMVKNSYKFADSSPLESLAIAADAADAVLVAPRSEIPPTNTGPLDPGPPLAFGSVAASASGSASQSQKRGRGRPPKPKSEAPQQEQPINVQPNDVQSNELPSHEQPELLVTNPNQVVTESAKRRRGRPRKDGAVPVVPAAGMPQAASMAVLMKRRGRPPGRRAAGRQRKPISVPATASVLPVVSNVAPAGDEIDAVAPGIKHGRGRPPKICGVRNKVITKPKRGGGRPAERPIKKTTWTVRGPTGRLERVNVATATPEAVSGATGTFEAAYEELKRKMHLAREKAKHISIVLQDGIASGDVQAVAAQAREDIEGLLSMLIVEPKVTEEVPRKDAALQTEIETQNEEQEREVVGEQPQTQFQPETQPHAEVVAMQDTVHPETEPETQPQAEAVVMQDTFQPAPETQSQAEAVVMQDTVHPETEPETQPQAEAVVMQDTVHPETEPETQPQAEAVVMQDTVQPAPETQPQAEAVAMQDTIQPETEPETQPQTEAVAMQDTIQPETEPETQSQAEVVTMQNTIQHEPEPETQSQTEATAMQDTIQREIEPETQPQTKATAMQDTDPAKTA